MDNFDLKKYLAEGRLLKETFVKLSDEQKKKVEDAAKRGEAHEDVIDSDFGGDDKYLQSVKALMDKLAENKLLKETFVELSDEQINKVLDAAKKGEAPEDVIDSDFGGDDKYLQSVEALMDINNFPELEDEFEDTMDSMIVEPEVYLQKIIDASAEEIVSDSYLEIEKAVGAGDYSAQVAVIKAKAWAKNKLEQLIS